MEHSIPALIIGAILILASSLTARTSLQSYYQIGQSLRSMETRLGEQSQTRLTIVDIDLDGQRNTLTVQLRNDGQTRLAAFDRLDVLITYYTSATTRVSLWLPYTASNPPAANNWTVASISSDAYDPGILNPGETAEVVIELSPSVYQNTTNLFVISSEAGVSVSAPFTS